MLVRVDVKRAAAVRGTSGKLLCMYLIIGTGYVCT